MHTDVYMPPHVCTCTCTHVGGHDLITFLFLAESRKSHLHIQWCVCVCLCLQSPLLGGRVGGMYVYVCVSLGWGVCMFTVSVVCALVRCVCVLFAVHSYSSFSSSPDLSEVTATTVTDVSMAMSSYHIVCTSESENGRATYSYCTKVHTYPPCLPALASFTSLPPESF